MSDDSPAGRTGQANAIICPLKVELAVPQAVVVVLARSHDMAEFAFISTLDGNRPAGLKNEDARGRKQVAVGLDRFRRWGCRNAVFVAHGCLISSERAVSAPAGRASEPSIDPECEARLGGRIPQTSSVQATSRGRPLAILL